MKREIDGFNVGTDDFTRLNSISLGLMALGFRGAIACPENGVNQVLAKLHETEEALAAEKTKSKNLGLQISAEVRHRNELQWKMADAQIALDRERKEIRNAEALTDKQDERIRTLLIERDGLNRQVRNLKAEIAELQRRSQNQFETIKRFQSYTGLSQPERRSVFNDRRSNPAIYPHGTYITRQDRVKAILALGAISPRTDAQTQALKELISSVRLDGTATFRTPGNDRRKK